jgi:hydrogenase nickel incorporation protein HypB
VRAHGLHDPKGLLHAMEARCPHRAHFFTPSQYKAALMTETNVPIVENILSANDRLAEQNHSLFDEAGILAINIMASPGAGKTSIILQTIQALSPQLRIGVVEGDTAAVTIDADKVKQAGVPAVQINTGGSCHLDASMLGQALGQLPLEQLDLLIVENVGNLVCPAAFKLGTHANVLICSVPEGDDKPYKYPRIYRGIDVLILNKTDLLPYLEFNMDFFSKGVEILNPQVSILPISCRTGAGIHLWLEWIVRKVQVQQSRLAAHGSNS